MTDNSKSRNKQTQLDITSKKSPLGVLMNQIGVEIEEGGPAPEILPMKLPYFDTVNINEVGR